MVPSLASGP